MNDRTALIHHFKQFPNRKIITPFLEWIAFAIDFADKQQLPLITAIDTKEHKLLVAINGNVVFQHTVVNRKHLIHLLFVESDLNALLHLPDFQKTSKKDSWGLALFTLSQELLTNPTTKSKWQTALELVADESSSKKIKIQHNDWIVNSVLNDNIRASIFKEVGQLPKYQHLLPKVIENILHKNSYFENIQSSEVFWFEQARKILLEFQQLSLDTSIYEKCLLAYQASSESFDRFVANNQTQPYGHFLLLLGQLIAHIEAKASNKSTWNSYEDKRTIAPTGIRQNLWVQQLIQYKIHNNAIDVIRTQIIKNALLYLQYPAEQLPILSPSHQQLIAHHLLDGSYITDTFTLQLISYFNQFDLKIANFENYTYLIRALLYHSDSLPLWFYNEHDIYEAETVSNAVEDPFQRYQSITKKENSFLTSFPLNQILYGPPGTGKTFEAIRRAVAIIQQQELNSIKQWEASEIQNYFRTACDKQQIVFTTFHQSMSYEDFLEGIKPFVIDGQVQYRIEDGIFKSIAAQALASPKIPHVLIIDEMNRGNTVSILGELITLLEEDKRLGSSQAIKIKLPYSKQLFGVPNNLYLIGTMNTIDRNTERLDLALRRRFDFIHMLPDSFLLPEDIEGINLQLLHQTINNRIAILLNQSSMIGHTYFMPVQNFDDLNNVFTKQIIPLLSSMFYGDYQKIRLILGAGFIKKVDHDNESLIISNSSFGNDRYQEERYQLKSTSFSKRAYIAIYE